MPPSTTATTAAPATPELTRLEPRGLTAGATTKIKLVGKNLAGIKARMPVLMKWLEAGAPREVEPPLADGVEGAIARWEADSVILLPQMLQARAQFGRDAGDAVGGLGGVARHHPRRCLPRSHRAIAQALRVIAGKQQLHRGEEWQVEDGFLVGDELADAIGHPVQAPAGDAGPGGVRQVRKHGGSNFSGAPYGSVPAHGSASMSSADQIGQPMLGLWLHACSFRADGRSSRG